VKPRKNTRKSTTFWASFWALLAIYGFTAWAAKDVLPVVAPYIVGAIAFAGFGYQVAQVGDNWQRSANYVPELDRDSATPKGKEDQ
jgi:hypothetical protein